MILINVLVLIYLTFCFRLNTLCEGGVKMKDNTLDFYRKITGKEQSEIAFELGLSVSYVSKLQCGTREMTEEIEEKLFVLIEGYQGELERKTENIINMIETFFRKKKRFTPL